MSMRFLPVSGVSLKQIWGPEVLSPSTFPLSMSVGLGHPSHGAFSLVSDGAQRSDQRTVQEGLAEGEFFKQCVYSKIFVKMLKSFCS